MKVAQADHHLFQHGLHARLWELLGAHVTDEGVTFGVWAPNAKSVALIADFNGFDGSANPMEPMGSSGIWMVEVPDLQVGEKYKFEIVTQTGEVRVKADPFAFYAEKRPATASIVWDHRQYQWSDQEWMKGRERTFKSIYELHLGSWRGQSYREIAPELAKYCRNLGFSHVEIMPITEYPLDESWGYQVTGYFAPTARYGTPDDFKFFVDHLHQEGIGVILDWVPGHFPSDGHGLALFDGSCLFEHDDPLWGYQPKWTTHIFDYGKPQVSNFLTASALFWCELYHIDGLRFDAIGHVLYHDYDREEFRPNPFGGRESRRAIRFFKHCTTTLRHHHPEVFLAAEDPTLYPGTTLPVNRGGLGFDFKWNMGWIYDSLKFFAIPPQERHDQMEILTHTLTYAFDHSYITTLSHDDVVNAGKSLIHLVGDLKLFLTWMWCYPGRPLLFMGSEMGQKDLWNFRHELPWDQADPDIQAHIAYLNSLDLPEEFEIDQIEGTKLSFWRGNTHCSFDFGPNLSYNVTHGHEA